MDPEARWQVPFFPVELAALNERHQIFLATGSELYLYDVTGNLLRNRPTEKELSMVTTDHLNRFWTISEDDELECLDEDLVGRWRRKMPHPLLPPRVLGTHMVYVSDLFVQILDPATGMTDAGRYVPAGISAVQLLRPYLFITRLDQTSESWLPGARIQPHHPLASAPMRFLSPGPHGRLAALLPGNVLRVVDAQGHEYWERRFNLDVDFAPVWLGDEDDPDLAVITQGRSILIFHKNGQGAGRFNMTDRPRAVIQCSKTVILVALQAEKEVIWYFHASRQFIPQTRSNHLTHLLQNEEKVLLIDYDGQIELFDRKSFAPETMHDQDR